jgi:integrase/recombinase XerD
MNVAGSRPRSECEPPPVKRLLDDYCGYLRERRGLAPTTVQGRRDVARRFARMLSEHDGELALDVVTVELVHAFVLEETSRLKPSSMVNVLDNVRCLLRYAFATGRLGADLSGAVPRSHAGRALGLPQLVDPATLGRLLESCDRSTSIGLRDFAILTLMVRLALRANEIASMRLEDVNWRAGELIVHGKGGQDAPMPLPVDVGEALVGYLRGGRPCSECRWVFLDATDPSRPMSRNAVVFVPRRASERAGIPVVAGHRLRHTAASRMLGGGATLVEIGQVLRHRREQTTAIYAAVDPAGLSLAARPWPGAAR